MMFIGKNSHLLGILLIFMVSVSAFGQDDLDQVPPRGQTGQISIKTTPEKAIAYLGGQKLGLTPVEQDFPSGRHTLTILLNGEEVLNKRINVWPNQRTIIDTALALPYGSVEITTVPPTCNVSIDGEDVGATQGAPLTINNIDAGTRVFKVYRKGKKAKEVEVDILPEQTVKLHVNLNTR